MKVIYFLVLVTIFQCKTENLENEEKVGDHVWTESSSLVDKEQDPSVTLLLKDEENPQNIHNNPLDNLSDLREIHQFDIDLSNYTDHEAVESEHKAELDVDEFVNHFNILPGRNFVNKFGNFPSFNVIGILTLNWSQRTVLNKENLL